MLLKYRGVSYEATENQPAPMPVVDLKYRGATYRMQEAAKVENLNAILKYRGVAYVPQSATAVEATVPAIAPVSPQVAVSTIEEKARILTLNHHRLVKNRQQTMLRRSAAAIGLQDGMGSYWNHIQGKIHPSFWYSYDRSHAALS